MKYINFDKIGSIWISYWQFKVTIKLFLFRQLAFQLRELGITSYVKIELT